ncbi:uncharacterized protein LY79DRAFT_572048 [Colletotrichum navitas]|uniref:Uncharacterized protein n=1 Tax=Colletotrichum navitas TaxID=681940 RepID=A0AAD8PKX3_9PEZI|nr:uncharacterized protein LY79DRAFT_572048 [Colletotrichum navitas]KAK1569350.1 hypothetical protein LY79DRAFT_572048 [Colletotrichum navitas]
MKLSIYMVSAVLATVATAKECTTSSGVGECGAGHICIVTLSRNSEDCPDKGVCMSPSGVGECSGAGSICLVTLPLTSRDCP